MQKLLAKSKGVGRLVALALVLAMIAAPSAFAAPIDFTSVGSIDVNPADVIGTGFNFMNLFGDWTMLVLALIFSPVVIGFLIWLFRKLPRFGGGRS